MRNMNKSLILYGSEVKLSNAHKCVTNPQQPSYYVRADLFHGDHGQALDKARPIFGECVLNTVPIAHPLAQPQTGRHPVVNDASRVGLAASAAVRAFKDASGTEAAGMDLIVELLAALGAFCDQDPACQADKDSRTLFEAWGQAGELYQKPDGKQFGQFDVI